MKRDIYGFDKRYEFATRKIKESEKISKRNKKFIFDFLDECQINGAGYGYPLSLPRVIRYANSLRFIGEWIPKDFDKAKEDDINVVLKRIETRNNKESSKQFFKITLKKFYKWHNDGECPKFVKKIKTTVRNTNIPWKLLEEEEIIKMIGIAKCSRDKAFLITLAESGARIGEMASLDIGSVVFDDLGVKILVEGKTGKRTIRLLASAPYLAEWINKHPKKNEEKSPLWVNIGNTNRGQPMKYDGYVRVLKRIAKEAEITKRVNPHSFRHARATFLSKWFKGSQRNAVLGWGKDSKMPKVYDHLTGMDAEDTLFEMCGIDTKTKKGSELKPKICNVCNEWNQVTSSICKKCARPLDLKIAIDIEEKRKMDIESMKNMITPEVLEGMIKKTIESEFKQLVKTHPNAVSFLDSIAEKILS